MSPLSALATFVLACWMSLIAMTMTTTLAVNQGQTAQHRMIGVVGRATIDQVQSQLTTEIKNNVWTPSGTATPPPLAPNMNLTVCSNSCPFTGNASCALGYSGAGGGGSSSAVNVNQTLHQQFVEVSCQTHLLGQSGAIVQSRNIRTLLSVLAYAPYVVPAGENDTANAANFNGTSQETGNTLGCDPTNLSGCGVTAVSPTLNNSALYSDTRLHVYADCAGYDPTECSQAGDSIPTDNFQTTTWAAPQ